MATPASSVGPGLSGDAGAKAGPMPGQGKGDAIGGKGGCGSSTGPNGFSNGASAEAAKPVWSCKIIVHAETLHSDFPTVSKIIGVHGANVEHVRSQTHCTVQLRGRGSGYLEPETGQELQENMFLFLTSSVPENGKVALDMVQDLLKSVYEEHQSWCSQHNLVS